MDTVCVELQYSDGTMIAINTIAVENEIADNMYQRSELDYLIYNDPVGYAELILNGDPETYLNAVTKYKPLDYQSRPAYIGFSNIGESYIGKTCVENPTPLNIDISIKE